MRIRRSHMQDIPYDNHGSSATKFHHCNVRSSWRSTEIPAIARAHSGRSRNVLLTHGGKSSYSVMFSAAFISFFVQKPVSNQPLYTIRRHMQKRVTSANPLFFFFFFLFQAAVSSAHDLWKYIHLFSSFAGTASGACIALQVNLAGLQHRWTVFSPNNLSA